MAPCPARQGVFNVGTGVGTSVLALAKRVTQAAGSRVPFQHAAERVGAVPRSSLDSSALRASVGWAPRATLLLSGLTATVAWLRQHVAPTPAADEMTSAAAAARPLAPGTEEPRYRGSPSSTNGAQ